MEDNRATLENYKRLNASFRRVLVYHCGVDTGFFTEYTRMVDAMLYCLEHKLQFRLYSDDANFGYRDRGGWTDYFSPFCPEVHEAFHHRYNLYRAASWRLVVSEAVKKRWPGLLAWRAKAAAKYACGRLLASRAYGRGTLLSGDVRPYADASHRFRIPELGIDGDYLHAFGAVSAMVWQLNDATAHDCQALCDALQLPEGYAGCQVRGGDKVTETTLLAPSRYVEAFRRRPGCRDVFVLTDDYRLFRQLQSEAPDIRWHTLCSREEKGYVNGDFSRTREQEKRDQMVRFLASMQLLRRASVFVGSITTGPSFFLLKTLPARRTVALDCTAAEWPAVALLPLRERVELSQGYARR